jgi:hypothetical protein
MKSKISRKPLWMFSGLIMLVLSIVLAACGNSGSPTQREILLNKRCKPVQAQARSNISKRL